MLLAARLILLIWCLLCIGAPLYAQTPLALPTDPLKFQSKEDKLDFKHLNLPEDTTELASLERGEPGDNNDQTTTFKILYNPPKLNTKESLRAEWKRAFGIDVWYPYYQVKKIEDWVRDRFRLNFFKMKGEPKLGGNEFKYTFSVKF